MKTSDAINRGNNLMVIVFIAALALAVVVEIMMEKDWDDKADDIVLVSLGVIGTIWYFRSGTNFSYVPLTLAALALLTKIAAAFIEFADKDAIGDEFGIIPALFLLVIIAAKVTNKAKHADSA